MKHPALSTLGLRTQDPPISWLMKMSLDHPGLISLAAGFTDSETLPVAETHELLRQLLRSRREGRASLQYGSTIGDPELRTLTARRLRDLDAANGARTAAAVYSPERVLIANGSQQMLYLLVEALCDPGDVVLVEDPTYFVFLGIMQSHGLRCCGVRMTEDGLDLGQLEAVLASLKASGELRRLKLMYLVTYHQNPTSITTALAKKAEALRLLRRYEREAGHPIYLVEDAAYRELSFAEPDFGIPSALAAKGGPDRVIYCGTYSKPFATGVRVGFGLVPDELFRVVLRLKGNHDFGTSNLLQRLLARALHSGVYERHLVRLRKRYARKAHVMLSSMREHFPASARWVEPHGGLYVWASAPPSRKTGVKSALFQAALDRKVLYVPGELCYALDNTRAKPDCEMRLSFGGATVKEIRAGIERLGHVLTAAV